MKVDIKQPEKVVITGSKPLLKMDIDKKVFNVEKNLVSAGGTAHDVMRNVPSLQVDMDGIVKLRNSPPQIFVDGRPTTLQLDQIPADAIENLEVITNPSAKYDASGGNAGILNIVLKKKKKSGYNGNVMAGIDRMGGVNGGGSFSFRQDKMKNNAATLTRGITDIFKTRYNSQYLYSPYFIRDYSMIMNPQMVRLNFSYRFGKIDMSLFKRQNMKSQAEGMNGGMQGLQ